MDGRVQFSVSGGGMEIRIKSKSVGLAAIVILVWLTGWTVGGLAAIGQMIKMFNEGFKDVGGALFLGVWLVGWAVGELMVSYILLRSFFGSEIIKTNEGFLTIKNSVLGLGRTRRFQAMLVQGLRTDIPASGPPRQKTNSPFIVQRNISFDYEGRAHKFGAELSEAEAKQVIDQMLMFLPNAVQTSGEQKTL